MNGDPTKPDGWLARMRWLAVPYWFSLALITLAALLFAMGGAHGSAPLIAFVGILALAGMLALLPIALFAASRSGFASALRALAWTAMCAVFGLGAYIFYEVRLGPQLQAERFERAMTAVSLASAEAEVAIVDGEAVGERLSVEVRIGSLIEPPYFQDLLYAIQSLKVHGPELPHWSVGEQRVMFNGQPLPPFPHNLAPGIYRVEATHWYPGVTYTITLDDRALGPPCRIDATEWARLDGAISPNTGGPMQATMRIKTDVPWRRNGHTVEKTITVQTSYRHSEWRARWPTLRLPWCATVQANLEAQRQAKAREALAAEGAAFGADGELYAAACSDDPAQLTSLIAAQTQDGVFKPASAIGPIVRRCAIEIKRMETLRLLAPAWRAELGEQRWCDVLGVRYETADIESLRALQAAGVPIACEGKRGNWRTVLSAPGTIASEALEIVRASGIDVCAPSGSSMDSYIRKLSMDSDKTLLVWATGYGDADIVEFALNACGAPAPTTQLDDVGGGPDLVYQRLSPAMRWTVRRHINATIAASSPAVLERLDAALLPTASELTAVDRDGGTLLHKLQDQVFSHPMLLRRLADAGARLDAADYKGESWFRARWLEDADLYRDLEETVAAIAELTPAQRRALQRPVVLATGRSGKPVEYLQPTVAGRSNPLYTRLCERQLIECPRKVTSNG